MESKDDPINLLKKDEFRFLCLLVRPMHLNTLARCCCYAVPNKYDLHKWEPNHKVFDKYNGKLSKRFMKLKEDSSQCMRCCVPRGCRGYANYFMAQNSGKVAFVSRRPAKCSFMYCARPEMEVHLLDRELDNRVKSDEESKLVNLIEHELEREECRLVKSELVGKVDAPWSWISYKVIIRDNKGAPMFLIQGNCW